MTEERATYITGGLVVEVIWKCTECGLTLGIITVNGLVVIHKGVHMICHGVTDRQCRCGLWHTWKPRQE